jgi:hypothetical protein
MIGMNEENQPNLSCVKYEKRGRYIISTIILFIVLGLIFVYLWTISPILSFIMVGLYLVTSYFQAYCCVYQDCPYIGGFCPAISGIYVGNILANHIYSKDTPKSEKKFNRHKNLGILFWLLMAFFPFYWIYLLGIEYAILYFLFQLGYYLFFGLTICPSCAIRSTCPGGKIQKIVFKTSQEKNS